MIWLLYAGLFVGLDQVVKAVVKSNMRLNEDIPVIDGIFHITRTANEGASFGILQGKRVFFLIVTGISILIIFYFLFFHKTEYKKFKLAMSLILGGAIGNFIDRLLYGSVVDMFNITLINFPVFNIADMCLTAGAILLCWYILFNYDKKVIENGKTD